MRGKTLGIVGVRPSSALLVERARALGMIVLACEPQAGADAVGAVECVAPEQVLAQADVLVVQTPAGGAAVRGRRAGAAQAGRARRQPLLARRRRPRGARRRRWPRGPSPPPRSPWSPGASPSAAVLAAPHLLLTSAAEASTLDARRRAGVSVAEQVAAVLRGRLLRGAVNVPAAAGDDADELMPYMGLCARLGRLLVQLAGEPVDAVEITYGGSVAYFDTRLLTLGVLGGVLADRAGVPVNFVNAEGVAAQLGVTAVETRESGIPDFPRLITVAVAGSGGAMSVSGTSLGSEHKPRLVRVFGEDVDIEPAPHMAFLRYVDAPGIGGKVGTLLGEWGVNIGHMSVGRGKLGDEAVMALTLDESLTRRSRRRTWSSAAASSTRGRSSSSRSQSAHKSRRGGSPERAPAAPLRSRRLACQAALRMTSAASLEIARMLPSLSLNQPVLRSPVVAMPFTVLSPGKSYSSNLTPLPRSSRTVLSTSSQRKLA